MQINVREWLAQDIYPSASGLIIYEEKVVVMTTFYFYFILLRKFLSHSLPASLTAQNYIHLVEYCFKIIISNMIYSP
jgi:hypothetical protein